MSNAQANAVENMLPSIGAAVGGPIGQGIGEVLDVVGQLFGGKTHYTPSGMTYSQATGALRDQETAINAQWRRIYGVALDTDVPPVGDTGAWWNYMTGLIARYLQNPALQTSDPKQFDTLKKSGAVDQAVQVQRQLLQALTQMAPQGNAAAPGTPPAATAAGVQGSAAAPSSPLTLASLEAMIPATLFGISSVYLLGGALVLVLIVALKR